MEKRLLAKAKFDNLAETIDELAFKKGDVLTVIKKQIEGAQGWWLCSLKGREGIVPSNRITLLAGMYNNSSLGFNSSPESSISDGSFIDYDTPRPLYTNRKSTPSMNNRALPPPPDEAPAYDIPQTKHIRQTPKINTNSSPNLYDQPTTRKISDYKPPTPPAAIYDQLPAKKTQVTKSTNSLSSNTPTSRSSEPIPNDASDLYDHLPVNRPPINVPNFSSRGTDSAVCVSNRSSLHSNKSSLSSGSSGQNSTSANLPDIYDVPRPLIKLPSSSSGDFLRKYVGRPTSDRSTDYDLRDSGVYDNNRALSAYRDSCMSERSSVLSDGPCYDIPRSSTEVNHIHMEEATDMLVKLQQRIHTASGALQTLISQGKAGQDEAIKALQTTVAEFLTFTRKAFGVPSLVSRLAGQVTQLAGYISALNRHDDLINSTQKIGDHVTRISTLLHANMSLIFSPPLEYPKGDSKQQTEQPIYDSPSKQPQAVTIAIAHHDAAANTSTPKPYASGASPARQESSFHEYDYCDVLDDQSRKDPHSKTASDNTADLQYIQFYHSYMQSECERLNEQSCDDSEMLVSRIKSIVVSAHKLVYMADTLTGKLVDPLMVKSIGKDADTLCASLRSLVHTANSKNPVTMCEQAVKRAANGLFYTLAKSLTSSR